ncbi:uncharacterized protein LOC126593931 [Malus sylvestris]|uniref:uncharacterized protein LOC126593931 n=1 Tax=Malus sylvestris TaxID=3752 RepID=UPI0021AC05C6|nr:uncharacterized protein LOC126593931 [Malus sylvestris]
MPTSQHQSAITAKPLKEPSKGHRQKVFGRLDPIKQTDGPTSVRRRLDFDAPFYNEDYYSCISSSSSSSANQKTFRPPEPRDQRWYSYNSPTGMYTALSKSQKRRRQRIDCLARRQVTQPVSATKWQPKETVGSGDDWPTPTIMAELQGQKEINRDFETTIEAAEKRIKLLIRHDEMKACFQQFKKEAESQLPPLPLKEPLIKVRRNLHPPFLGKSLEYMKEFHKTYFANDLYGLPKACQEALDLALTCPDAEQIIQKTTDPAMKARFQHIRKARVLDFEVDPYTDIDTAELHFSLDDFQHLRYHFEVFSTVSLFGLTVDETERVARLDAYLDTRNAQIAYEERARQIRQDQNPVPDACKFEDDNQQDTTSDCVTQALEYVESQSELAANAPSHINIVLLTSEDDNQDPMGHSVLENMEISMVHVLPAEFQLTTHQPSSLDGDVVAEETTQVDFVTTPEDESTNGDDKLKTALDILFPRSSSTNLQHLKPLYVTAHIERYPVSKVFVDRGATVNIMPINIMKALRRSNDELIPSGITMSSFVGDKSQTKGVLPLEVNIVGRNHMTAFFIVDSKTEYNALLGQDWIHQTSCIPSSLYQVLIF